VNEYIIHDLEIFSNEFRENDIYWRLYREVLPGYYEGTLQLIFTEPYSDWRHKQYRQRINVLVKDSTIISYQIMALDSFGRYRTIIEGDTNKKLLEQFTSDFLETYKTSINPDFLFIDSINYGDHCDENGSINPEYDKMIRLVATKNYKVLNEWLRCGNSELQLFALRGFQLLNNQMLDEETQKIIRLVYQKRGNINFAFNGRERHIQMDKLRRDYLKNE
jgi:hypothetical protein